MKGHTDVVDLLVDAGANVNLATAKVVGYIHTNPASDVLFSYHLQHGHVALGIAAENGHVAIAQRLLMEKVNINHQTEVKTSVIST